MKYMYESKFTNTSYINCICVRVLNQLQLACKLCVGAARSMEHRHFPPNACVAPSVSFAHYPNVCVYVYPSCYVRQQAGFVAANEWIAQCLGLPSAGKGSPASRE